MDKFDLTHDEWQFVFDRLLDAQTGGGLSRAKHKQCEQISAKVSAHVLGFGGRVEPEPPAAPPVGDVNAFLHPTLKPSLANWEEHTTEELKGIVDQMVPQGFKIERIKAFRALTAQGLRESKEWVEKAYGM